MTMNVKTKSSSTSKFPLLPPFFPLFITQKHNSQHSQNIPLTTMTHAITSRAPLSMAGTHSPPPATITNPAIPTRYHHNAIHTPTITPPTQPYALHPIFDAHPSHHHQANSSNSIYYHQPQPYSGPHTQTRPPPFFSPSPPQIPQQHNPNYDAHAHPSHHQWPNNTNNNYYHQPQPYGRPHIQPLPPPFFSPPPPQFPQQHTPSYDAHPTNSNHMDELQLPLPPFPTTTYRPATPTGNVPPPVRSAHCPQPNPNAIQWGMVHALHS